MLNAASRMQTLINDLLHFSRVTGKTLPFTPVNLQKNFNEVVSDMEVAIEESHAKITSELGDLVIDGDPSQLRQLFQNLLANAIKFRKDGVAPAIRVYAERIMYPAAAHHHFISISVEDNGIGFDEKYADRIFNIFQRLEGKKYPGSGIGLTICRKIAHRHGGTISVKSRPGEGTVFTITLPEREIKTPAEAEAITMTT
jgi:two-component system sensor kinase FixL